VFIATQSVFSCRPSSLTVTAFISSHRYWYHRRIWLLPITNPANLWYCTTVCLQLLSLIVNHHCLQPLPLIANHHCLQLPLIADRYCLQLPLIIDLTNGTTALNYCSSRTTTAFSNCPRANALFTLAGIAIGTTTAFSNCPRANALFTLAGIDIGALDWFIRFDTVGNVVEVAKWASIKRSLTQGRMVDNVRVRFATLPPSDCFPLTISLTVTEGWMVDNITYVCAVALRRMLFLKTRRPTTPIRLRLNHWIILLLLVPLEMLTLPASLCHLRKNLNGDSLENAHSTTRT
jgi:hypothetical protein